MTDSGIESLSDRGRDIVWLETEWCRVEKLWPNITDLQEFRNACKIIKRVTRVHQILQHHYEAQAQW